MTRMLIIAMLLAPSSARALNGEWLNRTRDSDSTPLGRRAVSMAWDAKRDRAVIFGGIAYQDNLADTWAWDGDQWSLLQLGGLEARGHAALAYDKDRDQMLLFGGLQPQPGGRPAILFGDTWELTADVWRKLSDDGPPPRGFAAVAYDEARGEIVLFGGQATAVLADTWWWSGDQWNWFDGPGPPARLGAAMAYDAARKNIVMFGGSPGGTLVHGDTWLWDGDSWEEVEPATTPLLRTDHRMAYDSHRKKVVMYGGATYEGPNLVALADLWLWDGDDWEEVVPETGPEPRRQHGLVYDPGRRRTILYGGVVLSSVSDETWELYFPRSHLSCTAGTALPLAAMVALGLLLRRRQSRL